MKRGKRMTDYSQYTDRQLLEHNCYSLSKVQGCMETIKHTLGTFIHEQEIINNIVEGRLLRLEEFRKRHEADGDYDN